MTLSQYESSSSHAPARAARSRLTTLPTSLRGSLSMKTVRTGTRYGVNRSRHHVVRASSLGPSSVHTTNAQGTSPRRSSATPTTAASRTPSAANNTSSTVPGNTLSPPRLIMSDTRLSSHRKPSSSNQPRSPVWNQPSSVSLSRKAGSMLRAKVVGVRTITSSFVIVTSMPASGRPTEPSLDSPYARASAADHPTTSPPSSVWPYELSTITPNLSRNRAAWTGDRGAVIDRTIFSGERSVTDSSYRTMASAAGGKTVDRN